MSNAIFSPPQAYNEPVLSYAPGTKEKALLKEELSRQLSQKIEIPLIIGGKEVRTGKTKNAVCPHDHGHILGTYHEATEKEIGMAIEESLKARKEWENTPWEERAAVFHKAASLISTKYHYALNAATMLNQSKNCHQSEIDAIAETVDFFRFNAKFMEEIYSNQPLSDRHVWNRVQYRPLEGFIFAVTPFNFTAIGANLPTAPAIMGNTVVWKPASTSVYSNYLLMKIYKEAGLPDGVINFLPGAGRTMGKTVLENRNLAGIHFTGSTEVFNSLWKGVADNLGKYVTYPRLVGETGGKDFLFMHPSADVDEVACAVVRGAFEYQGQKCSACSRIYIPKSRWKDFEQSLMGMISQIKVGTVLDFTNFMNAVIDEASFDNTMKYIEFAKKSSQAKILYGGEGDKSKGYFIQPRLILTTDPHYKTMEEEIFAPVLTAYVYDDNDIGAAIKLLDTTSPYALTGSIFASDRHVINKLTRDLVNAAGNFYINNKTTAAMVGHQPFGGSRASGTNDKAGSYLNLIRWTSPRTLKECFTPPTEFKYPFMGEQ